MAANGGASRGARIAARSLGSKTSPSTRRDRAAAAGAAAAHQTKARIALSGWRTMRISMRVAAQNGRRVSGVSWIGALGWQHRRGDVTSIISSGALGVRASSPRQLRQRRICRRGSAHGIGA